VNFGHRKVDFGHFSRRSLVLTTSWKWILTVNHLESIPPVQPVALTTVRYILSVWGSCGVPHCRLDSWPFCLGVTSCRDFRAPSAFPVNRLPSLSFSVSLRFRPLSPILHQIPVVIRSPDLWLPFGFSVFLSRLRHPLRYLLCSLGSSSFPAQPGFSQHHRLFVSAFLSSLSISGVLAAQPA
jgi:hypothetical protein